MTITGIYISPDFCEIYTTALVHLRDRQTALHGERGEDRQKQAKMVQEVSGEEEFNRLTGQKGKLVVVSLYMSTYRLRLYYCTVSMTS